MTSSSRKARRDLAKKMGFLKNKPITSEWMQRVSRSIEMGKKIHVQTIERQVNMELNNERIGKMKEISKAASLDTDLYQIPDLSKIQYNPEIQTQGEDTDLEGPISSSI